MFNSKTIKRLCSNVKISTKQKKAASKWLNLLESGQLEKERQNYFRFGLIILKDILGYPVKEEMGYEEGNVEFTFSNNQGRKIVCFEAKGTKTKNLFAPQYRYKKEHSTPVKQTWDYMGALNLNFGIVTNYKQFVLIDKDKGTSKYHLFDFKDVKNNEDKLKEFIGIFSKNSIVDNKFVNTLYDQSVIEEKEFTRQFYRLFHETRLMLIKEFQNNGGINRNDAIHYTQLFLNRMVFIFFAEDTGKIPQRLFRNQILAVLNAVPVSEHSRYGFDTIYSLFESLDKGTTTSVKIFGFNGGLFRDKIPSRFYVKDLAEPNFFKDEYQHSELKKKVRLDEFAEETIKKYQNKINPIITNLLYMSSFDFNTELNVNIMGNIFEQSLNDLEYLKENKASKRKKEGIFYTPDYVTEFICKNTIIQYLSKNASKEISELIQEYSDDVGELEKKFKEIKILDPACGSGAFLLKAVDILLEIHKEIQTFKEFKGQYNISIKGKKHKQVAELFTLTKWNEESEAKKIIESNIFGVDVNEESVEITKLSLFLKIASSGKKLIDLSENIKIGNSLVDDKTIDPKAFDWKSEFPSVLKKGGFDVIIGNPPYIRVQFLDHKIIDWLKQNNETAYKRIDISNLFFELAKRIMKEKGLVSFITSNQFLVAEYGRKSREFLLKNFKIHHIIDFGDLPIFEDALTYASIFTFENASPANFNYLRIKKIEDAKNIKLKNFSKIKISSLDDNSWTLGDNLKLKLLEKLKRHSAIDVIGRTGYGLITGADKILLLDKEKIKKLKIEPGAIIPVIVGTDPEKYMEIIPSSHAIYPYKVEDNKTKILDEADFKKKYPNTFRYVQENKKTLLDRKDSRKTFRERKDWYGLVRFGMLENFHNDKIITPGEVKDHKFTIDYNNAGFLAARVFCIVITNKQYDLRYVLAILNSNIVKFFLHNTTPLKQGGYYGYSSSYLDKVPIPSIGKTKQKIIVDKVEKLFELNKNSKNIRTKFLNRITINLDVKINKKIKNFEKLEFNEFIKELSKQKKILSLNEQDEWEDYFIENKNSLIKQKIMLKKLEEDLEDIICDLYCLSSDEQKLLKESLN